MSEANFETKTETKAHSNQEMRLERDTLNRAFDAFQETNNERLSHIEKRMSGVDILTEEKLARIEADLARSNKRFEDMALKNARPQFSTQAPVANSEHKQAFENYIRTGETSGFRSLETRAIQAGVPADGGYLVPHETESFVMSSLSSLSPFRNLAQIRQISSNVFKQAYATQRLPTGWVAEAGARTTTNSLVLEERQFPTMELYAMPAATQTILDDAVLNIDEWVASEVEMAFAEQETTAFVAGNGTTQPKGFTTYTAAAIPTAGQIGYTPSGAAGAFAATNASDALINLIHSLRGVYRTNGTFTMNRNTLSAIRKLKDTSGNYIWKPANDANGQSTLLDFPVVEVEAMPDMAAASGLAIAFADWKRAYLIVDRLGVRVLRDPYSSKPYTLFYTTKRVGGGVLDFDAIKFMKFAVS